MYKIVGICCILAGCVGWGNGRIRQEKDRVGHLRELIRIMRRIQEEISYGKHTLPEICVILANNSNSCYSACFAEIYRQMMQGNGTGLKEAWSGQLAACLKDLPLQEEEKGVVRDLPMYLGIQEETRQAANLEQAVELLVRKCRLAEETYENKTKVIRSVSILAGLLLSILLL